MENSVKNTRPAVETVSGLLNDTLPASVNSAAESLNTARDAAVSMESAVKQMDTLQSSLNTIPLLNSLVPDTLPVDVPEKPLSDSLGELSGNLEGIPESFKDVSRNLNKAAGDLKSLQSNLEDISGNVDSLSANLKAYKGKLAESRGALDSLKGLLDKANESLTPAVTVISVVLTLIFFCLLMTQVVVIDEGRRFLDREDHGINGGLSSNRIIQKG
jgi:ABC-type transporter Mla subunit MlaD